MGENWEAYCKLADAEVAVQTKEGERLLPVHTSELARLSPVLLQAVVGHKESEA